MSVGMAAAAWPVAALAQPRVVRVGVLSALPRSKTTFFSPVLRRLAELGYVEKKNLVVEFRSPDGNVALFSPLAADLLKANCDVLLAIGSVQAPQALLENKTAVPIVIVAVDYDPVQAGIVTNLRHPGGTVTGVHFATSAIAAKWLEILRDVVPNVSKVLVLGDPYTQHQAVVIGRAAQAMHIKLVMETFGKRPYNYAAAFAKGKAAGATAIVLLRSPVFSDELARIGTMALQHQLPVVSSATFTNQNGILVGYGVTGSNRLAARAGDIVVQILDGKKPGDIPLEEPTEFELVINAKTAKQIGLEIPKAVAFRADRIIE